MRGQLAHGKTGGLGSSANTPRGIRVGHFNQRKIGAAAFGRGVPMTESITAYLLKNGWQPVGLGVHSGKAAVLWNHDEPGLRSVNGFPVFRAEACKLQRERDRREVGK